MDRCSYESALPWPHLVVDGMFSPEVIAEAETQELVPGLALLEHRSHRQIKAESSEVSGPAARRLLSDLTSSAFVRKLTAMTGIGDLRPDTTFFWGGIHVGRPGAFQAVHSDFQKHPETGLYHRVAALLYLNSQWEEAYGGDLELWTPDITRCVRRIQPRAGRLVLLETSTRAVHGVPEPVRCPAGRARLTLAAHYYSESPPPGRRKTSLIRRPRRPQDPWHTAIARPADAMTVVRRRLEDLRGRRGR